MILKKLQTGATTVIVTKKEYDEYISQGYTYVEDVEVEMNIEEAEEENVRFKIDGTSLYWKYESDFNWTLFEGGSGVSTSKVKASATDTTEGYLGDKLVAGTNVTITKNNSGANETYTIASTSSGGSGVTVYADIATLKAVNTTAYTAENNGDQAQVYKAGEFVYDFSSTATGDDLMIIQPTNGVGRWLLQASTHTVGYKQTITKSTMLDGTVDTYKTVQNGKVSDVAILPNPTTDTSQFLRKTVITLGDSNMAGYFLSPTGKANRYVMQLKTYLASTFGYDLIDVSISANSSLDLCNRFGKDVAPYKPSLVIVSLSLTNLNLKDATTASAVSIILNRERYQILKLIGMIKAIGSDFAIMGYYPHTTPTAIAYEAGMELNSYFKKMFGERYIDYYENIATAAGAIATRYDNGDGVHFNKLAHDMIYQRIKHLNFSNEQVLNETHIRLNKSKGITLPVDVTSVKMLKIMPNTYMGVNTTENHNGFTVGVEVLPPATALTVEHNLIQVAFNYKVLNVCVLSTGYIAVKYNGASILTTTTKIDSIKTKFVTITYKPGTRTFVLFLGSEVIGETTAITDDVVPYYYDDAIYIGCTDDATKNCSGYTFRNVFVYRMPITKHSIAEICKGELNTGGLEFYNALDGAKLVYMNYANSQRGMIVNGAYSITDGNLTDNDFTDAEKSKLANAITGTFTTVDGKTITITGGMVTSIV